MIRPPTLKLRRGESGEGEIRTRGHLAMTPVFKTGTLDRYVTSPKTKQSKLTKIKAEFPVNG